MGSPTSAAAAAAAAVKRYKKVKLPSRPQHLPQGIITRQGILEFVHPQVARSSCPPYPRTVMKSPQRPSAEGLAAVLQHTCLPSNRALPALASRAC